MHRFLDFIIPGSYLYKRKCMLLGDLINISAGISISLATYLYYSHHTNESIYSFTLFIILLFTNIFQLNSIRLKVSNPALIQHQSLEFRKIIESYLQDNQKESINSLAKVSAIVPNSYELDIFMVHLLKKQAKEKESNKLIGYLNKQPLSIAAKSLLFAVSKK